MSKVFTNTEREQLIAALKTRESKDDIVALIGNLPTMRLILIWPTVAIHIDATATGRYKDRRGGANLSQMRDTKKIWVGVEFDIEEVAAAARIPRSAVRDHISEAQLNGWIYPDNTVHQLARDLAKGTIVKVAQSRNKEHAE